MNRLFLLALTCLAALPARAEDVLARFSPLPLVAEDGSVADSADMAFGAPLRVLADQGGTLLVSDATGREFRVRAGDVVVLPPDAATLRPDAALAAGASGRPDMPLWDSLLRARTFLGSPQKGGAGPILTLPSKADLPDLPLPVLSAQPVRTSIGSAVTLLQVLVPVQPAALAGGARRTDEIMLHVITDGSDYAAGFALDALDQLSRRLAGADGLGGAHLRVTRQVIHESGETRFEGEVPVSHLRADWPAAAAAGKTGGLTQALSDSIAQLADVILPGDETGHLILILAGPGLADGDAPRRAASAAGDLMAQARKDGADLRGIVLLQATPEPNPANDVLLRALSGGAPTRSLGFGGDAMASIEDLVAAAPPAGGDATVDCGPATAAGLVCLAAQAEGAGLAGFGGDQAASGADWVATPLWLVAESAPFHILPQGVPVAEAAPLQGRLRACLALGRVWAAGLCQPSATAGADPDGRIADLSRQLADLAARSDDLRAALDAAEGALDSARDDRIAIEADLTSQIDRALRERDGLADDLAQAQDDIQALSQQLDDATDALSDARAETDTLRDSLTARLDDALAERDGLAADLEQAQGEGRALVQQLADATDALSALRAETDGLMADLAARDAAVLDAQATLAEAQDRIADLEATAATLTAQAAEVAVARADEQRRAADEAAALRQSLAERETQAGDLAARLAAAETDGAAAEAALAAEQAARQSGDAALRDALQRIDTMQAQIADLSPDPENADAQQTALMARIADEQARRVAAEQAAAAAVADRDALVAALDQARAAEGELATLRAAQADLLARAEAGDRAADRVMQLEADIAMLREAASAQASDAASPTTPAPEPAPATAKPRPRPAAADKATAQAAAPAPEPAAAQATAQAAQPAPAPQGSLSVLSDRKPEPSAKRRVAPAQQAPQLNGCAFQWVGKEGRLVCP